MSMPIQRQSEQFAAFDSGPRWERDRSQHDLPKGLAGLVNSMGPRISSGLLNTRTASSDFDSMDIDDIHDLADSGDPGARAHLEKFYEKPEGYFTDENYSGPGIPDRANNPYQNADELAELDREHHEREFPHGDYTGDIYPSDDDHDGSYWPGKREAGWNYPEFDRTDIDDYDHDLDRPSAADFAEEDFERERKRNYPRGQGPAWNYDEDGDPDPYLEHLEETSDPERFISGSRRRLAVEEDYSGGDEDDPDWIRDNSPRQQEHNRKRGEEISRSKEMFGSRHPFDRAADARLAACQECGEEIYPDEGWHHINGYPDEYDHEANPESVDFDGDEYGMHKDPAEAYDKLKYRQLQDEYRQGSRTAKDSKCTCWEGYERVPGTEPCSEDSCRKESMRLAGAGIDDRDVRPGPLVDVPLYEQDPDDYFGSRPYSGPHCPDCGKPMRWVSGPTCRHGNLLVDAGFLNGRPDHTDVSWQETADGWEHPVTGCRVQPSDRFADEWEMVAPTSSKRKPYSIIDHHTDPHAMMARHDRTTGYAPKIAEVMQAQPQVPIAGGYLPGHQVYSLWRGEPRHGIVTALEAPNTVWVRYHDGQHLPENPGDIQLR